MRIAALALAAALLTVSCGRDGGGPAPAENEIPPSPAQTDAANVPASDSLPGLTAAPSGIAFWVHPNVAFNSLIIVASTDGVVSYNVEDGNEVSRIPGVNAQGAAVSYLGFGPAAAGVLAFFDADTGAFKLYGVDNVSRAFLPIKGGPAIGGAVQGFCFGRAQEAAGPALFVVQKAKFTIFNFEAGEDGVGVASTSVIDAPDDTASCAVDIDGVVLVASASGDIFRLDGGAGFDAPFTEAAMTAASDLSVLSFTTPEGSAPSLIGQIALLDQASGIVHLFDREDGHALGAAAIAASDDIEGVSAATAMGVTGANLGGLYRNGAIALGVGGAAPSIRLIPLNGVINALSLPEGEPVNPRGTVPEAQDEGLVFETGFQPR